MLKPRARKVKILATLGPASSTPEMILALMEAGADAFRINMSHGEQAEKAGDPYRALEEYIAALKVDDKHTGARRRLTALRAELAPRLPALYEQGKHYFQDEDLEKALAVWRDALLIAPDDQRTKENVDRAERILSRLEEIQTRCP